MRLTLTPFLSDFSKTLLTMGLQRETASRGTLAIYISVCLSLCPPCWRVQVMRVILDCVRCYV
jgi:hypothetical protein